MRLPPPADRCGSGGLSAETRLELPSRATVRSVAEFFKTIGDVTLASDLGVVKVKGDGFEATLHSGGPLNVRAAQHQRLREAWRTVVTAVMIAGYCTECGVCARRCRPRAITSTRPFTVDERRCNGCLSCRQGCVVVTYIDRLPADTRRR